MLAQGTRTCVIPAKVAGGGGGGWVNVLFTFREGAPSSILSAFVVIVYGASSDVFRDCVFGLAVRQTTALREAQAQAPNAAQKFNAGPETF